MDAIDALLIAISFVGCFAGFIAVAFLFRSLRRRVAWLEAMLGAVILVIQLDDFGKRLRQATKEDADP